MGLRATRRYDANGFSSHRVGDKQEPPARHTYDCKPIFAIILAIIQLLDRERVSKHVPRRIERDTVIDDVRSGLAVVPLESSVIYNDTA